MNHVPPLEIPQMPEELDREILARPENEGRLARGEERGIQSMSRMPPLGVPEISEELGRQILALSEEKVAQLLRKFCGRNFDRALADELAGQVVERTIDWLGRDPNPTRYPLEKRIWYTARDVFRKYYAPAKKVVPFHLVESGSSLSDDSDNHTKNYSAAATELRQLAAGTLDDAGRLALKDILQKALSRLSADEEKIVRWRHLLGLSFEEIAILLNRTPGAIKTADCRALKKLRQFLLANKVQPPTSSRVRNKTKNAEDVEAPVP